MFGYILSINAQPENLSTSLKFEQVINKIEGLYVDSVDGEDLTEAAIIALLEKLDPHSTYMPKKAASNARFMHAQAIHIYGKEALRVPGGNQG